ncbi:hypothetical protein AQPE_4780 [Aquipluma nitroreducens]|uniref:Uncharacterized protein n=1 Tax=Aquipluma nitroreducens TaxID=2010828 RepID=A0A5K7SGG3_9BACT|nr:hypothetical protein AQPE_4780 [Aquipluma nitroreducens]
MGKSIAEKRKKKFNLNLQPYNHQTIYQFNHLTIKPFNRSAPITTWTLEHPSGVH